MARRIKVCLSHSDNFSRRQLLDEIGDEVKKCLEHIDGMGRPLGDRAEAAQYAYRQVLKIIRRHYIALPSRLGAVQPLAPGGQDEKMPIAEAGCLPISTVNQTPKTKP